MPMDMKGVMDSGYHKKPIVIGSFHLFIHQKINLQIMVHKTNLDLHHINKKMEILSIS